MKSKMEKVKKNFNIKNLNLGYQIFIIIFLIVFVLTSVSLYATKYNVNEGFQNYLQQREMNRDQVFTDSVKNIYKRYGSFNILTNNNGQGWFLLLNKNDPEQKKEESYSDDFTDLGIAQNIINISSQLDEKDYNVIFNPTIDFIRKVALLDANSKLIIGDMPTGSVITKDIVINKKIVGKLVFQTFNSDFFDTLDDSFMNEQTRFIYMISAIVFFFALILTLAIINFWLAPIKQMINSAKEISKGNYNQKVCTNLKNEIGVLAESFNNMALSLKNNEESKKNMIADISHELRTPLTIIKAEIESFIDGVRVPTKENLEDVLNEINSLNGLVNEIHQVAIYDLKNWSYEKETVSLTEIFNNVKSNFDEKLNNKNIKCDLSVSGKCVINGDKQRLEQLFNNLFENTLKYTNDTGILKIKISETKKQIELKFEDSYPGVTDQELNKIFDRFYRVENSRNKKFGGSGLGLTLCKQIVEKHNGIIIAEHSNLGGICFTIKFNKENV